MNKKGTDIVAYLGWIGLLIAFLAGDKEASKFHINQSLVLNITASLLGIVGIIPILGWIVALVGSIFVVVCWFIGFISAIQGTEKAVPLLGSFQLLK